MVNALNARMLALSRAREDPPVPGRPHCRARAHRTGRPLLLFILVVFSLPGMFPSPHASASGLEQLRGIGARAIAMGGAYTAVADDASAVYYNPAGLAQLRENHFQVDYVLVAPQVVLQRGSGPGERLLDTWVKAPVLEFALDLSDTIKFPRHLVFGLNAYISDNLKNAWKIRYGSLRHDVYYPLYGDMHEEQGLGIWACLGFEIFPWLLVGGGVNFQLHSKGVYGELAIDTRLQPVKELSRIMIDVTTEIYPMLGVLLKPLPGLRLGFTWREESDFKFGVTGIGATVRVIITPEGIIEIPLVVPVPLQSHFRPTQYAAGVSYELLDELLLAADVTYHEWETYSDNAARVPNPPLKGVLIPRVGVEYGVLKDLALRGGYSFQKSPLEQQVTGHYTNYVDNDVHMLSLGFGYTWQIFGFPRKPARLNAFYQLYILVPRTFENVHPGQPDLTSSGFFHCFGFGVQFFL